MIVLSDTIEQRRFWSSSIQSPVSDGTLSDHSYDGLENVGQRKNAVWVFSTFCPFFLTVWTVPGHISIYL